MAKNVKILGAGLSGLTAAINLAKRGYKVEVYEKFPKIGDHYGENPQMLPNWFSNKDVIKELEECGIEINWLNKIEKIVIWLGNKKITFNSNKTPIGYTVLRGGDNSFENDLARQARKLGIRITTKFNKKIDADIIATGESKIYTVGYGRVYKGVFNPNKTLVFFDKDKSLGSGYRYLFPHSSNIATVKASKSFNSKNNLAEDLKNFINKKLSGLISEKNFLYDFGSKNSFFIPKTAVKDKKLFVGEAAGFQDELFRFGMRYAIISGYLAAKSITENLDYDLLWKKRFSEEFKRNALSKKVFYNSKKDNFKALPKDIDIQIDIEKFRKLWLSKKIYLLLKIYPLFSWLLNNEFVASKFIKRLSFS